MPRDGNGNYTFPANSFNPAVADTEIDETDWNAVVADIQTAMSASIAKDGQTTTTAAVPFAAGISTDTVAEKTAAAGVTADSVLLKDGGVDVSGAASASGQIKFPATQNASSNVNTLDDYEEGVIVPGITFGGAAVGVTYGTQSGSYTKIGNRVLFDLRIILTSKGSSTGAFQLTGLPFLTANIPAKAAAVLLNNFAAGVTAPVGSIIGNGTTMQIYNYSAGSLSVLTEASVNNTSEINISGHYCL
jgi:hypothetical protein